MGTAPSFCGRGPIMYLEHDIGSTPPFDFLGGWERLAVWVAVGLFWMLIRLASAHGQP